MSDVTKLLKRHNTDISRTTVKYKHTHTAFVEGFNKVFKQRFKHMDAEELQVPERVWGIWVKNLGSIIKNRSNTKSSMINMKRKDAIKLDSVGLDKRYCIVFREYKMETKNGELHTLSGVKSTLDQIDKESGNCVLYYLQDGQLTLIPVNTKVPTE